MANDEPPYLTVGTDVSAKYKGAFCEAKIKKANRVVKCKVTFKNNQGSFMVTDDLIKGPLRIGADIEAKHPEKNQFLEAVINKLQDYSQYTVVFDDGDETTLRRTSLCLKSGRHFAESPTLDQFPLTNPEHFGTPVIGAGKYKRKRRSTMNSSLDYESSDDDPFPRKLKAIRGKERDPDLGKVVAVDYGDRRKKDSWYPGLIVPHPAQSTIKISKEEHLIRSFKDGKYYQVPKRDTREFSKDNLPKIENNSLKTAVDKAIQYLEKEELPANWEKQLFMGLEHPSADEDSQDFDSDSSDDEPSEVKDRFVAQLYKFMDERGTPINKAPSVCNKDLNLYKLFKIMHKLGGFNKVTNQNKWKTVYVKMGLPQSNANGPNQIKGAYKRYLQSFEDFYRKLGCTMVNNSRSTRGRHRSDRNFIITRTRDRDTASPKGRNSKDTKDKGTSDKKPEEKPRMTDKKEVKREDSPKPEEKPKSPEKKKIDKVRPEDKDDKQKKEERPRLVRSQSLNKDKKSSSPKEDEKKDSKPEKARTREDARKEKNESPEKKGTRSSLKMEIERKEKEELVKEKKDQSPIKKEKKEEKPLKDIKEDKIKDKKDDKVIKDRKLMKDKKLEEKTTKEKVEGSPEKKKEEKQLREKRDSSKEPKEERITKGRKEEVRNHSEEKSPPKKKLDRLAKDKKEDKVFRPKRDTRSPLPDSKKNIEEDIDSKTCKEEKNKDCESKKDKDESFKEKPGPRLRERREDTPTSEEDDMKDALDDKDSGSQDGFEKKGPGAKFKDDNEEPPNKGRKRSLKSFTMEKDLEDMLTDSDDDDQDKDLKDLKNCEIELGDRVKVKYGRGRLKKVYDAKVLKIQADGAEKRYFVHYNGWNNRYDEWVKRNFIVALANPTKQSKETSLKSSPQTLKKIERGRPPGPIVPSKPARKNSTSSTNSSLSCSRATRSEKKSLQSPLSSGLEPKKRSRKKFGLVGLTDTSQDSDSDVEEPDLDDDDVGDADIEDNANTQNDSCFKEELFSDDEEKEKLEDVKRDDIKELEKAISVEEIAEDVKEAFFNSVKGDEAKPEIPVKEEIREVVEVFQKAKESSVDPLPGNVKIEAKHENENKNQFMLSLCSSQVSEKIIELKQPEKISETEKKLPSETSVIANVNKTITKPVKVISSISALPEVKNEKPIFSSNPPKIAPFLPSDQSTPIKEAPKISNIRNSPVSTIENRNLSFAGLHGLIQINAFERNTSVRNLSKDINVKIEPSKVVLGSLPPKIDLKLDGEPKNISSSLFRSDKLPLFGSTSSILNPPKLLEPVKTNDKPILKNSIFGFAIKPNEEKDQTKDLKLLESSFKFSTKDTKDKPEQKSDDAKIVKLLDTFDKKPEPSLFKHCVLNPSKFSPVKTENVDTKPDKVKDEFDRLVESTSKKPEMKTSIFPLSFSNVVPKEKFIPDQPFSKIQSLPADNLCCIKPKLTETFDLSKTIPSILERLKKDVVADVKGTESPPPQKEELSFNFLRSSQDTAKSLSRSESSNSLRICEDMSDTNDSNTDSKDLVSEKLCAPSIMASTASDNAVCSSENLVSQSDISKSETAVVSSVQSPANISESKDEIKSALKTSVITVASIQTAAPVLTAVVSEPKKDAVEIPKSEESNLSLENDKVKESPSIKADEEPKIEVSVKVEESESSKIEGSSSMVDKEKSESLTESNNEESSSSTNLEKSVNSSNNTEKDSLFDDLLKIKNTNTNYNQSSVIMWNNETKVNTLSDDKLSSTSEERDVSQKEEPPLPEKVDESIATKDNEVPSVTISEDENNSAGKIDGEDVPPNSVKEIKSEPEENENPEDENGPSSLSKKEAKKKRLGKKLKKFGSSEGFENDGMKFKEGKSKSKKRRLEGEDADKNRDPDLKSKSKKIKKNKNKKRLAKHEDLQGEHKKVDQEDDHKDMIDKIKKKEKRKSDKKFFKSGMKGEFSDSKLELKKKKGKKNRDKLSGDKKDFLEKKTKKKKKPHIEENQDTDSDKESSHNKSVDRKKKKDKKKFKAKDSSSSDDAGDKFFKDQNKTLSNLPMNSNVLIRQDSKSDDPDMSFLLCEEKVPASPVGINNMADDTSDSSSIEGKRINSAMNILPLPNVYPCLDNIESSDVVNKHNIDTSAVLDNTPPTTPSSTESLLSSSPSHERDSFSMNYPESTQSGRDSAEGESDVFRCSSNRTVPRASEEYRAAATLAFAVCKTSVAEKPKEEPSSHNFLKRQKSEVDEHSPSKRKKKSKRVRRCSESGKSPRHKSSLSRLSKIESCCEDSSGAFPASSSSPPYGHTSMNFSRSPHRFSCSSEGFSRYNFYVPLHEKDPEKRIALLQDKMAALRKEYRELRAKFIALDHKRRKARKKIREAGTTNANPSAQTEDGQSCS